MPRPDPLRAIESFRAVDFLLLAKTLAIGSVGGAILAWFQAPLAWMIGAMVATSAFSVAGVRQSIPGGLRSAMIMILGIMLGSAFRPEIASELGRWSITVAGLLPYTVTCLVLGIVFLRYVARFDPVTAYFTATPGGLTEMVIMGGQMGGDDRMIALGHSARIMIVVMTIPFVFQFLGTIDTDGPRSLGPTVASIPLRDYGLLAICTVGAPVAAALRIPAAALIGPMILSAVIHLAGLTSHSPPGLAVAVAQVVVGSAIGSRFAGVTVREIARIFVVATGLTIIMLGVSLLFALGLHAITGIAVTDLILAYAPGGLAEMSLVSLALGGDAAFVSTHHIVRILLVIMLGPLAFMLLRRYSGGTYDPPDPAAQEASAQEAGSGHGGRQ